MKQTGGVIVQTILLSVAILGLGQGAEVTTGSYDPIPPSLSMEKKGKNPIFREKEAEFLARLPEDRLRFFEGKYEALKDTPLNKQSWMEALHYCVGAKINYLKQQNALARQKEIFRKAEEAADNASSPNVALAENALKQARIQAGYQKKVEIYYEILESDLLLLRLISQQDPATYRTALTELRKAMVSAR